METYPLHAPVLEIYAVWHPGDNQGKEIADSFLTHFRGDRFSGLLGGTVDVYGRSAGLHGDGSKPPPIPFPGEPGVRAHYTVVVPMLGEAWAKAVEGACGPWHDYAVGIRAAWDLGQPHVGIFPLLLDPNGTRGELNTILGGIQRIAEPVRQARPENPSELRIRDLSQALAKLISGDRERLTVFISHTMHGDASPEEIVDLVRRCIGRTRLGEWIDYHSLQPGSDSVQELLANASSGVLLAVRTDEYASREWCQREVFTAKRAGVPVVVLDALQAVDRRGSFLMDHAPRLCVGSHSSSAVELGIQRALNLLVDEYLGRVLWRALQKLVAGRVDVDWWAPQAPEPTTFTGWLTAERMAGRVTGDGPIRILHPGPPLGLDEKQVLNEIAHIGGIHRGLDITTSQLLAARGA
ncbi:hypothetical protein [Streptomyces hokutonensis]|uniref:hypothetical protein n=1 Tax=Streptomyces hokutonensis TaxID=1306990 RepID=UPI00380ADF6A